MKVVGNGKQDLMCIEYHHKGETRKGGKDEGFGLVLSQCGQPCPHTPESSYIVLSGPLRKRKRKKSGKKGQGQRREKNGKGKGEGHRHES